MQNLSLFHEIEIEGVYNKDNFMKHLRDNLHETIPLNHFMPIYNFFDTEMNNLSTNVRLSKRFRNFFKEHYIPSESSYKIDKEVIKALSMNKLGKWHLKIMECKDMIWVNEFQDHGSCFFSNSPQGKVIERARLASNGASALLFHNGDEKLGRCLKLDTKHGTVLFNFYGITTTQASVIFKNMNPCQIHAYDSSERVYINYGTLLINQPVKYDGAELDFKPYVSKHAHCSKCNRVQHHFMYNDNDTGKFLCLDCYRKFETAEEYYERTFNEQQYMHDHEYNDDDY